MKFKMHHEGHEEHEEEQKNKILLLPALRIIFEKNSAPFV
jgi:hypothetical protein